VRPSQRGRRTDLPDQALGFRVQAYGMTKHRDLFTARQLVALTTFSDLVGEARERVCATPSPPASPTMACHSMPAAPAPPPTPTPSRRT
jgi:hypothetical protein